jgi:DNA repair protein RadC
MTEDNIIDKALSILKERIRTPGVSISSPDDTIRYLTLKLAESEHEKFCVMFLDNRHRLIAFKEMFHGTIDGASVHPREVVKLALQFNAAAVVFSHNHPSGDPEPSRADKQLTRRLTDALALIDIRVLDHVIIGGIQSVSFAGRGLL